MILMLMQMCMSRQLGAASIGRVAMVREKIWKMKKIPGHGKVREFQFQSGKFRKMKESHGKVREFQNFPKKLQVNRLVEVLFSINCKP